MKSKNGSSTELGERNLLTRVKIINSFKLSEEAFLKKYFCDRETLFTICRPSFKKLLREKADIKLISLYLSNLKKFTTLLQNIYEDNNNSNKKKNDEEYLKLLKNVSEHILYEHYTSNKIIMKYGDKADKFYLILHGLVSIIIPIKVSKILTFSEYSRYIALLILYQEFELAKIIIKDNKSIFNIDLPEMKFIIQYINKYNIDDIFEINNRRIDKNIKKQKFRTKYLTTKNVKANLNIDDIKNIEDEDENEKKIEYFMANYLTRDELKLFMKIKEIEYYLQKNENSITPEIYINRLKNYKNFINDKNVNKYRNYYYQYKNDNLKTNEKEKRVFIYEYQEIIQMETGEMFGDIALGKNINKRTATIISLTDSYFGCLNKEIYFSIKESSEKNRKKMIEFLYHIKLFKYINNYILESKYFNYFAFKDAVLGEYIIKNGKENTNIIIIKKGIFEICFNGTLKDIFYLMNYYKENYKKNFSELDEKKYKLNDYLSKKVNKINRNKEKIKKLFSEEKDKNYEYKLFIINNVSIFGLEETENNNGNEQFLSFFDIKCISNEGEYVLLDKRIFYKQIYAKDFKIKEETKLYVKEYVEKTIDRFVHLLYSRLWKILTKNDMKIFKNLKKISSIKDNDNDNDNTKNTNLMNEIGLDFDYMNRNNLTDIECIIDKILEKYNEDAFDYKGNNSYLYNYWENKKKSLSLTKNMMKIVKEKYNNNKFNIIIKDIKKRKNRLLKSEKKNTLNIKALRSPDLKNKIKDLKIFGCKNRLKMKFKLSQTTSTFYDEKYSDIIPSSPKIRESRNFHNFIQKEDFPSLSIEKKINSYLSGSNISSNFNNYNNISKIKKNDLVNNIQLKINKNKHNILISGKNNYKNQKRCNSVKLNNHSNLSYLDSIQMSKDFYIERRKEYILKNTRSIFTKTKNFILYKRRKKKIDKNI